VFGTVERVNDHVAVPPVFEPRQRYWRIFAAKAALAAGAEERLIVFGGNDVPGVMTICGGSGKQCCGLHQQ
jgi:methylglutamate dehydrogenase subunit C